ncbi:MAG: helix-turn-helix domain-containing protein [Burkholderiaceae bacterium]
MDNRTIAVLAYDGVNVFELGIAMEVFGLSGIGPDWYRVAVCGPRSGVSVAAGGGVKLLAEKSFRFLHEAGTVIVPGWHDVDASMPEPVLDALRRAHARGARIASICNGVYVVAAAGLLDGRRVAAHWAQADALARRFPRLTVDPKVLYVDDGDILSSAGRAAGLDLCVHIVRKDFGATVANEVARRMVISAHREGGQAQFLPEPMLTDADRLGGLRAWARSHLDRDLTIEALAAKARISRRTLIRRFVESTGLPPGEWVLQQRLSRARRLLETTARPIEEIATSAGFGSADVLRHHFRERFSTSPIRYRQAFRG